MNIQSYSKWFSRIAMLFVLMFLTFAYSRTVNAAGAFVSIAFDQSVVVIGRTPRLAINISNTEANPIRATKLECIAQGNSIVGQSISQLPGVIAANGSFNTEQYYRAASPGLTNVRCELTATDTVTGATVKAVSPTVSVEVLAETRLYFDAYSATRVATVGQSVYVIALYGNRGKTPFTNISISCVELGRSLVFVTTPSPRTTIPPGQSAFVEYRLQAVRPGSGPIACSLTATDSVTGGTVTLPAPTINIEVR